MGQFAVLHAHSEFSTRDSLIRVSDLATLAAEAGFAACALTDHGGVEGAVQFHKACCDVGIKPILGCEIYVGVEGSKKNHHLTILAKNASGFLSLQKALSYGHKVGWDGRRRAAVIPINYVLNNLRDCVVLSGCASSPFWRVDEDAVTIPPDEHLAEFVHTFGDDFFFEVQPIHDWDEALILNQRVLEASRKYHRPVVVTPDCHFECAADHKLHDGLLAVASAYPVGHEKAWKFSTRLSYFMTPEQLTDNVQRSGFTEEQAIDALVTTDDIAARCSDWDFNELPEVTFPIVEGDLRTEAYAGLRAKGPRSNAGEYVRRLDEELAVFENADLPLGSYMLLVRECVRLFKSEGACIGPRGSVGGSLVGYLLGLCELDPIKHGLPWQRFYAPGRQGWPDVDIDVDDAFRTRVPTILRKRFGEDHVAQLSTYGEFGIKSAVRAAARAYAVDLYTSYGSDEEPEGGIETYEAFHRLIEQEPEAGELAKKLVGRVQQFGAHAGGFVVTAAPVTEGRGAIVNRSKDKTLNWDMHAAEELGYVKLDFLGNASLSALKRIETGLGSINWDDIPLDDEKVYDDFAAGRTAGVPQFLTSGMRVFVETLKPSKFDDLVWANAAFRPGGLGTMKPAELVRRYRKDPGSVIVYQEDVMQMCVGLAGFTWGEADAVRKVVAKSRGTAQFEAFAEKFVAGCLREETLNEEEARQLWTTLADFGRYAFNKAHAASYSWNGYRIQWAKRYHTTIAFSALLNIQSDKTKDKDCTDQIIDEADDYGVMVRPAHCNKSGIEWVVDGDSVRAPLRELPHGDARIAKAIMRRRDKDGLFKDEADFTKRMGKIKRLPVLDENAFRETNAAIFASEMLEPKSMIGLNYKKRVKECNQCDLRATCKAPVPAELNNTNVLIVGDKPGGWEDSKGKPFMGDGGKLLVSALGAFGIDRKDVSWTTAVHCKPPYPKDGGEQIYEDVCPWLEEEIRMLKPPLALAVGRKTWQKMGGSGGIMKANATVLPGLPLVVGCVSPNAVLHDAALFPELERAVKKFSKLYFELVEQRKGAAHANASS